VTTIRANESIPSLRPPRRNGTSCHCAEFALRNAAVFPGGAAAPRLTPARAHPTSTRLSRVCFIIAMP
jgi:hypothetical protein